MMWRDFLTFKQMVTPLFIQALFWMSLVAVVVMSFISMFQQGFLKGLMLLILGPISLRIACEGLILLFSINDNLVAIKKKLAQ